MVLGRFGCSLVGVNRHLLSAQFGRTSRRVNDKTGALWPSPSRRVFHALSASSASFEPGPRKYTDMATLETLHFDNLVLRSLPIDEEKENFVRPVNGACFSKVSPTPVEKPEVVAYSLPAMELLDLSEDELKRAEFAEYFSGNKILPGSETAAHCYCGHQFGNFAGQLGDGAAMYLGEVVNKKGDRWEIQLKGAGPTPYSRSADGRKVLRSTIREFLCSEAIHHLGIPTTRAGSCVTSDTKVMRDIFYSGDQIYEKATIVLRMAPSFIRFGSFEIFKAIDTMTGRQGPSVGRKDILEILLNYVIKTFYPEIWAYHETDKDKCYVEFYREVVRRTAQLVAEWQCVGWCHGVLNTDNMSILGLTIDYGPYGFMDRFDPEFICNASDNNGRYTYKNQPAMCKWNCRKLAEALHPVVDIEKTLPLLDEFHDAYDKRYSENMHKKFGLSTVEPEDGDLIQSFLDTMQETGADFTNTFRCLSSLPLPGSSEFDERRSEVEAKLLDQCCSIEVLKKANEQGIPTQQLRMMMMLLEQQPGLLEQLGMGRQVIDKELARQAKLEQLQSMKPEQKKEEDTSKWRAWLDQYIQRLHKEVKAGDDLETKNEHRVAMMNGSNPRFILRNYIAQNAIEAAEKGDYSEVQRVLKLLESPYAEGPLESILSPEEGTDSTEAASSVSHVQHNYDCKPPLSSLDLRVT